MLALTLCTALAGCGESGAKRSVDARSEALSFFAKDAPALVLLRTEPPADLVAINQVAAGLPAWDRLRAAILAPLHVAGLGSRQLRRLAQPSEELEGIDSSALALGAPDPGDLASGRQLLVLATDQSDLLSRYLRESASAGRVKRVGTLDGAGLYEGPGFAFAARDGVLVSAARIAEVRAALRRRDGDRDKRLDDGFVESLWADLQRPGPLLVYADLGKVRESDPGLEQLGSQAPWTGKLGPTAASARVEDGALKIEDFSKTTDGDLTSAELPIGAEPSRFEITAASAASLIPPGPVRELLLGLAPIRGEATASSDEVRLQVTVRG